MNVRIEIYPRVQRVGEFSGYAGRFLYNKADNKSMEFYNGISHIEQLIKNEKGNSLIIGLNLSHLNSEEISYINEWIMENKEDFNKQVAVEGVKKDRSRYIDIVINPSEEREIKKELGLVVLEDSYEKFKMRENTGENILTLNLRTNLDVGGY